MTASTALGVRPDSKWMVRALGLLYILGSTLAAVSQLLPHSPRADETAIWVMIALAYAMVPVVFTQYQRLAPWAISLVIAVANSLISAVVYFQHEGTSPYAWFYVYVTPYALAFFSRLHALGHLVYLGAAYGAVLAINHSDGNGVPGDGEVFQWLQVMGAVLVTMLLVGALSRALSENLARIEQERRRRAMDINDDVVQRLVLARQSYEAGERAEGDAELDAALAKARRIMADLVIEGGVQPGSLRRDTAFSETPADPTPGTPPEVPR